MKSKLITISAVSAGLIAVLLSIGTYFEFADVFTVVLASVFVLLPLYYNSYKGGLLAYLGGGVLAFIISGFNFYSIVYPAFLGFFGVYPLVLCYMRDKRVNQALRYLIGAIWCIAVFFGIYYYYTALIGDFFMGLPQWVADYAELVILPVAIVFYFAFDRFIILVSRVLNYYLSRIIK
ncbi:MAG: hypothetical protein J6U92_00590 [Clostridia bacterium]|nr:hypothetical protein [Clostridia bacterium]